MRWSQTATQQKTPLILKTRGRYFFMNTTFVALFNQHSDAEPWQKRLSEAGIPAEINDGSSMKGSRSEGPADRFEQAYRLLLDWDMAEGALRRAIRCPECKS